MRDVVRSAALVVVLLAGPVACSLAQSLDDLQGGGTGGGGTSTSSGLATTATGGGDGGATSTGAGGATASSTTSSAGGGGAGGANEGGAGGDGSGGQGGGPLSAYAAEILADGPVGWWRLGEPPGEPNAVDEVSGDEAIIASSVERGVPGALPGDPDTAFAFDGMGSVLVGDVWSFDGGAPFTLECWVKLPAQPSSYTWLMSKEYEDALGRSGWGLLVTPDGYAGVEVWHEGDQAASYSQTKVPLDTWTHLAATYDGTTLRFFQAGFQAPLSDTPVPFADGDTLLTFGESSRGGGRLVGALDEVAVYDRALSPARLLIHVEAAAR